MLSTERTSSKFLLPSQNLDGSDKETWLRNPILISMNDVEEDL